MLIQSEGIITGYARKGYICNNIVKSVKYIISQYPDSYGGIYSVHAEVTVTDIPYHAPTYSEGSYVPTFVPSVEPSFVPSVTPSIKPTVAPTFNPTATPSIIPASLTLQPSVIPTYIPTCSPTVIPTITPTFIPTYSPTYRPTLSPTSTAYPAASWSGEGQSTGCQVSFQQSFGVFFQSIYNTDRSADNGNLVTRLRSGNPGYLQSSSIIYGVPDSTNNTVTVISEFITGLTVPSPMSHYDQTQPLLFGKGKIRLYILSLFSIVLLMTRCTFIFYTN